jgi:hypothetical protein
MPAERARQLRDGQERPYRVMGNVDLECLVTVQRAASVQDLEQPVDGRSGNIDAPYRARASLRWDVVVEQAANCEAAVSRLSGTEIKVRADLADEIGAQIGR